MFLFGFLGEIIARAALSRFVDLQIQAADATPADLLVRFSVAAGVVALGVWLFAHFLA